MTIMGGLPRRDLWLLPLIVALTILVMLVGAEAVTRVGWPEQREDSCAKDDPVLQFRFRPNCRSIMKAVEGPWYTNRYNDCGYRSEASCGPVPAGTRRVALIGSSVTEGYLVAYPDSIAANLQVDLTALCAAPVQTQNLGGVGYFGNRLPLRTDEALALHPDALMLIMAPFDLEAVLDEGAAVLTPVNDNWRRKLFAALKLSRAVIVAQHFLFQNPDTYLPLYLRYGDKADFLRVPFSANWQKRLRYFDWLMGEVAGRARRAHVPFTVAFVPQEAQLVLEVGRTPPPGIFPTALPESLAAIVARHGAGFIDTSLRLRREPNPELLYYQVDGHLGGQGQRIAASFIADRLAGTDGPFADCRRRRFAQTPEPER